MALLCIVQPFVEKTKAVFGSLISRESVEGNRKKQYSNAFVHKLKIQTQPRVSEMHQQEGKLAVTFLHNIHLICITRCKSLISKKLYVLLDLAVGALHNKVGQVKL